MYGVKDIIAVVVLYKCDLNKSTSLLTLNDSVKLLSNSRLDVVVYDNSAKQNKSINLTRFPYLNLLYQHDKSNPGVSSAYNFGARKAEQLSKKWLVLLDQDTDLAKDYIDTLIHSINEYPDEVIFAPRLVQDRKILSPCRYKLKRGSSFNKIENGIHELKGKSLLNSGLAIDLELYIHVKGYNEEIGLYFSDFAFIDKVRKFIKTFVLMDVVLHHSMSSNDESDIDALFIRFSLYCQGAKQAANHSNFFGKTAYLSISLSRALKLSLKMKRFRFFYIWVRLYLKNHPAIT